jgi:uncharacterized protein YecT (DUF1311 family)
MEAEMRKLFQLGIAVFGLLQSVAIAGADEAYDHCLTVSDGSNTAWSACGAAYLERLDGQLNETWQTVFPTLTAGGQADLRAEQRAWIAFKELSCRHLANGDYGREGQVLEFPVCRAGIIEQRIEYLRTLGEIIGAR